MVFWDLVKRGLSILFFLLLLLVVNILSRLFSSSLLTHAANFLNQNVWLLILLTLVFLVADVFLSLKFPLNLPAPIFYAIGSMMIVTFVFRVFVFVDVITGMTIFSQLAWFKYICMILVPIIVLIVGYVNILQPKKKRRRVRRKRR